VAPATISAIVATLDLKLVRLIRAAMQDDRKHAVTPLGPAPQDILPRKRIEPEPRIEPRQHIHPTPYFEPRPVYHPTPRYGPRECPCVPPPCDPLPKDDTGRCRIQPPWKVRPWEAPMPMKREVKVVVVRPDIVSKGSLIDFFC
jgi:hypothetical protein